MIYDDAKRALEHDLMMLNSPEKRVSYLRGYLDFVLARYEDAIRRAEQEPRIQALLAAHQPKIDQIDPEVEYWGAMLDPLPTPRQIMAMTPDEGRRFQCLGKFKDGTFWITDDRRFLESGKGMKFYKAFENAWNKRRSSGKDFPEIQYLRDKDEKAAARSLIENEIDIDDILDYEERVKQGTVAVVVGQTFSTKELVNSFKSPMLIETVEWPSVEQFILAHQFDDLELREKIRTGRTLTEMRKMIRKMPLRADWAEVRDDLMRQALTAKFQRPYLRALLRHSTGFRIQYGAADPHWHKRMGELLMEFREKFEAEGWKQVKMQ